MSQFKGNIPHNYIHKGVLVYGIQHKSFQSTWKVLQFDSENTFQNPVLIYSHC